MADTSWGSWRSEKLVNPCRSANSTLTSRVAPAVSFR